MGATSTCARNMATTVVRHRTTRVWLIADVELPAGTTLDQTSDKLSPFEDFLQEDESVKSYQVSIGGEDTTDPESPVRPGNTGQAFINVKESADVGRTLDRIDAEGDDLYGETSRSRSSRTARRRVGSRPSSPAGPKRSSPMRPTSSRRSSAPSTT